jgi:hypothetical protein
MPHRQGLRPENEENLDNRGRGQDLTYQPNLSVIQQYFSFTTNQLTVFSVITYESNEQKPSEVGHIRTSIYLYTYLCGGKMETRGRGQLIIETWKRCGGKFKRGNYVRTIGN